MEATSTPTATLEELVESATKGCPFCILRLTAVKQVYPELSGDERVWVFHDRISTPGSTETHLEPICMVWNSPLTELHKQVNCFYGRSLMDIILLPVVPSNTRSARSLQTVLHWITICDKEHECMKESGSELPRRVLDVRNDCVRLYETTSEDQGARNTCLSHCWGPSSAAMLQTTTFNLSSHKEDIQ